MGGTIARERRWAWLGLVLVGALLWAAWPLEGALGQQAGGAAENYLTRLQLTQPLLRPVFDAPAATVRGLAFSKTASGDTWLYCAGDDKLVHRWLLTPAGNGELKLETADPIVWPVFSQLQGLINAIDVRTTPTGDFVALGGRALKGPEITLWSAARPDAQQLLHPGDDTVNAFVHGLDLNANGTLLAVGHDSGVGIRLWSLGAGRVPDSRTIDTKLFVSKFVKFNPAGNQLAVVGFELKQDPGRMVVDRVWHLRLIDPAKRQQMHTQQLKGEATGLAWLDNDRWIVARRRAPDAANDGVLLGVGKQTPGQFVGNVSPTAMSSDDRASVIGLAVHDRGRGVVQLHDRRGERVRALAESFVGEITALAVSPAGDLIAAAGVANLGGRNVNVVRVWRVGTGELLAQVPGDEESANEQVGPISRVGLIIDGNKPMQLGFAWGPFVENPRDVRVTHQFGLILRQAVIDLEGGSPSLAAGDGTRVTKDASNKRVTVPGLDGGGDQTVNLPNRGGNAPRCFAHLGNRVAVAYPDAILVLDTSSQRIVHGFFGHAGNTNCLAFSPDGEWLLSGGDDGGICGWSLNDFGARRAREGNTVVIQSRPSPHSPAARIGLKQGDVITSLRISNQAAVRDPTKILAALRSLPLGQSFTLSVRSAGSTQARNRELRYDRLGVMLNDRAQVVDDPLPYSPAWEAGFSKGQVVREVKVHSATPPKVHRDATSIVNALRDAVPGVPLEIQVDLLGGGRGRMTTRVLRDPLWTFFPQPDGNWCLHTPSGAFDCSKDSMDRLRWHVNLNGGPWLAGAGEGARLFQLGDFLDLFNSESQIDEAIAGRLPEEVPAAIPPPRLDLRVNGDLAAQLTATASADSQISEVALWINGQVFARQRGREISATVPKAALRDAGNLVVGVASLTTGQGTVERSVVRRIDDQVARRIKQTASGQGSDDGPQLHYLGVGVTNLDHDQNVDLAQLQFTGRDAKALSRAVGRCALPGGFNLVLTNESPAAQPTEKAILDGLKALASNASPNDLAIVFLAGHGLLDDKGRFHFIAKDTRPGGGVTDVQINDALSRLPCRSVLLMDSCHSGEARQRRQLRNWPGLGLGSIVVSACRDNEFSTESNSLGFNNDLGHGLFTAAILEWLTNQRALKSGRELPPRDANEDGQLTLPDLLQYIRARIVQFEEELVTDNEQHPTFIRSITFKDADTFKLLER